VAHLPERVHPGLSEEVSRAVPQACRLVLDLIDKG